MPRRYDIEIRAFLDRRGHELTARMFEVVDMFWLREQPASEIAAVLGISAKSVHEAVRTVRAKAAASGFLR
jgi:DNA-directed RNA polymerase specialized sigma24 family protein